MKRALLASVLVLSMTASACAGDTQIPTTSPAPLTIQVTGPENLVQRTAGQSLGIPFGGCGYSIDWGDGAKAPENFTDGPPYCEADLTHKYASPGNYTITVETWDQGPADEPVNQAKIQTNVTVQ